MPAENKLASLIQSPIEAALDGINDLAHLLPVDAVPGFTQRLYDGYREGLNPTRDPGVEMFGDGAQAIAELAGWLVPMLAGAKDATRRSVFDNMRNNGITANGTNYKKML